MNRALPALLLLAVACAPSAPKPLETKTVRSALEIPQGYRPTPYGWMHESCIHVHPSGTKVDFKHPESVCEYPKVVVAPKAPGGGHPPTADGWMIDTNQVVSTPMIHMTSIMQVPDAPSTNSGQLDYFFPGASPTNADSILQPVLQYGQSPIGGGNRWGIGSWSCDVVTSAGCHGSDYQDVATGDVILGTIDGANCDASGAMCDWNITTTDLTSGVTTTLNTTGDIHAYPWLFSGVLEAYGVTKCSDYPANGTESFSNVIFKDAQNNPIQVSWQTDVGQSNPANCPVMDATFTSTSALLKFTNKTLPTVTLSPGDGVANGTVSFTANATAGSSSTLSSLTITRNGTQVAAGAGPTLNYPWDSTTAGNGVYTFAATAVDADGASATAYSTLKVMTPPMVTLTAGTGGMVSGQARITVSATPPNGTSVAKIELSYGGNVVATSMTNSLSYMLDTTTLANGPGSSVTATATDVDGSIGSATLQLTVANPPQVTVTAPAQGGGMVPLTAAAMPANGTSLTTLSIQVDGQQVASGGAATLNGSWDSSAASNGSSHAVQASAVDADGITGQSAVQMVVVKNLPRVQLTSAATGEAGKPYPASATATAPNGTTLTQLVIQIDGEQAATAAQGQLSYSWKTDEKSIGTHQLTAIATASDGTVGSGTMSFTITKAKGCGCDAGGAAPLMVLGVLALIRRRR